MTQTEYLARFLAGSEANRLSRFYFDDGRLSLEGEPGWLAYECQAGQILGHLDTWQKCKIGDKNADSSTSSATSL